MAWSDRPWVLEGATVHVAMVGFDAGCEQSRTIEGVPATTINPDLTGALDLTRALHLAENEGLSFMGVTPAGSFDVPGTLARQWLDDQSNPNGRPNSDVVRPYFNGKDLTDRHRDRWIVDFSGATALEEAASYQAPFEYVRATVRTERLKNNITDLREHWWLYARPRPHMREALALLSRYIGTSMVAKHRLFSWIPRGVLPANLVIVIARGDDYFFGVLHSSPHIL